MIYCPLCSQRTDDAVGHACIANAKPARPDLYECHKGISLDAAKDALIDVMRENHELRSKVDRLEALLQEHINCLIGIKMSHPHMVPDSLVKIIEEE